MRTPALVAWLVGISAVTPVASAAPLLAGAEVRVAFLSPTSCTVDLAVTVEGTEKVEHRVEIAEGSRVTLLDVRGATPLGDSRDVGRTRSLVVRPQMTTYTLRYEVEQPEHRAFRCPLWIPTVAADGLSRDVHLAVRIPVGATAAGTMPAFTWTGEEGTSTIGHLPAFVRVPFGMPGTPMPMNVAGVMDIVSIATLLAATVAWARRRLSRGLAP